MLAISDPIERLNIAHEGCYGIERLLAEITTTANPEHPLGVGGSLEKGYSRGRCGLHTTLGSRGTRAARSQR